VSSKEIPLPGLGSDLANGSVVKAQLSRYVATALHDERWNDCSLALIAGGKSNLTYQMSSRAGSLIVRRPPPAGATGGAHDVKREFRVLSALGSSSIPVPRTFIYQEEGGSPIGAPFYVMEHVVGHICRNRLPAGYAESETSRRSIGMSLVDVLCDLHEIDPSAVGLADLGRPEGFLDRQLDRWERRLKSLGSESGVEITCLHAELMANVPEPQRVSIIHGDFRLDNTVLHSTRPGEIAAVLDWEMSTLGDPLTDLAMLLLYWPSGDDDLSRVGIQLGATVSLLPGFPDRSELVQRYTSRTNLDVSRLAWYVAFALFKLAVVLTDVNARSEAGFIARSISDQSPFEIGPLVRVGRASIESESFR
jgi:aminoglycoside phosphotransferase (APT) family kinase protein